MRSGSRGRNPDSPVPSRRAGPQPEAEGEPATTEGRDAMSMSWQVGLYVAAVLLPLAAFAIELIFIRQLKRANAYLATGAIGLSCLLSLIGFVDYFAFEAPWLATTEAAAA